MKSELKKPKLLVTVMKTHFVFFLIFFPLIRPISAYGNLAQNPSMEGSFIPQGSLGDVAEYWTGWEQLRGTYDLKAEFSEGDVAHEGSKSQKITWDNPYPSYPTGDASFGYDYIYQQIDSLQSGKLYLASVWFKGTMGDSFPFEGGAGFSLFGAIGADHDGGTDPSAVSHWSWTWMKWHFKRTGDNPFPAWYKLSVPFSPNGSTVSVFVRMYGDADNYTHYYDPIPGGEGDVWRPHPWHVDCYIDDVVVEQVEIVAGSTVEATSSIAANGVGYSEVTITLVDASGIPLAGVPASAITVYCTGNGNTIVGPDKATNEYGRTTARIISTVAETKTVSVSVFDILLVDTVVVEFVGGPFGPTWYVDADATGANDGSSWADAFNHLQDALFAAQIGHEIHVAQGSYKPDQGLWVEPGRRQARFQFINGVTIKGGYAGFGEPAPNARDITTYETILSGDLTGNDVPVADPCDLLTEPTRDENSYHVLITGFETDEMAILDGFTITAGNANGSYPNNFGGGLIVYGHSSPTLRDCTFTGNSAEFGGGIGNISCTPMFANCTFSSNSASYYGGGFINDANASPTLIDCEFTDNSAEYGGGMRNQRGSSPTLTGCNFSGNSAANIGGGMRNRDSSPSLTDCTFTANSATHGGAIADSNSSSSVTNCMFTNNPADEWGGGMFNGTNSSPTVTGCIFTANSATYGGAIADSNSSSTVTNCTFTGNSVESCGGGMFNYASRATVTNCTFMGNSAESYGGGMHNESNGNPTVTGCLFSRNSADYGGGVLNFSSSPMLTNCTFTANSADSYGGGIYEFDNNPNVISCVFSGNVAGIGGGGTAIEDSTATIVNCTFSGNAAANGNALACESEPKAPSNVELANCILWDGGSEILNNDSSTITITYSDVQSGWPGLGNIDTAPSFVNPGHWDDNGTPQEPEDDFWVDGDYHLQTGSTCIDAGNNTAVPSDTADLDGDGNTTELIPLDIDGWPRFVDDPSTADTGSGTPPIVDMGAYEFQMQVVTVPSVVGMSRSDAESAITSAGLTVGTITRAYSNTVPAEDIISQNPLGGTSVLIGSAVDLVVSDGPQMVIVPSVVEMSRSDAESAITSAGLTVGTITRDYSNTVPAEDIISQNPLGGTSVLIGSAVDLVVSDGPQMLIVPSVVEMSRSDAESAITSAGLTVGTITRDYSNTVPAEDIISQNPLGGTSVLIGSAVDLVVSDGPQMVIVPSVVGMNQSDAESAITSVGLIVGDVTQDYSDSVPAGYVISQNPGAGQSVVINSEVDLVISRGPHTPVIYVDDDAPNDPGPSDPTSSDPLEDGSQAHPFDVIQEAIDLAFSGDTVIVAEGTYYENLDLNGKDIILTSTDPSNQNVVASTIVNGDGNDSVVHITNSDVTIAGFTITNGFAAAGGGIYSENSNLTISDCIFSWNIADIAGGGMYMSGEADNAILTNCIFKGNSAEYGGAIVMDSEIGNNNATLVNCLFFDNSAVFFGGVMDVWNLLGSMDIELINCTLAGNSAPNGNALSFDSDLQAYPSNLQVSNCILWNGNDEIWNGDGSTITINYSDIQSGWGGPGENNINVDPSFVDADNDNFHLLAGSQCIDAGNNNALPPDTADLDGDGDTSELIPWDLDGNPRIIGDEVDMGAYEFIADGGTTYHPADTDSDYVIDDFELLDYIDLWADGQVEDFDLLDAIDLWAAGHYYWDESEQKFKPGEKP